MPLAPLAIAALLFGSALEPRRAADPALDPAVPLDRAMSEASLGASNESNCISDR